MLFIISRSALSWWRHARSSEEAYGALRSYSETLPTVLLFEVRRTEASTPSPQIRVIRSRILGKIFDIITSVIQITRYRLSVYDFWCAHIGNVRKSGKHAFPFRSRDLFSLHTSLIIPSRRIILLALKSKFFNLRVISKICCLYFCHTTPPFYFGIFVYYTKNKEIIQ